MTGPWTRRRALTHLGLAGGALLLAGCSAQESVLRLPGTPNTDPYIGEPSLTQITPDQRIPAPVADGPKLGGGTITTADYRGQVVVLNVWGSWCAPCRKEAPDLEAAHQKTKKIAQFIGINTRDLTEAPALAFVRAFKITYPHIYDPDGAVLTRFSQNLPPSAIPSTLIIDRDGRTAARVIGTITERTLIDLINDIAGR